jgi:signal transduction histidine kinase/ActR/RegA family two-component response regulator
MNLRRHIRRSAPLRVHLVLLVVGAMLPVALFGGFVVLRMAEEKKEATTRHLETIASLMAVQLEGRISATLDVLGALAEAEPLHRDDLAAFHVEAQRVLKTQRSWLTVILVDSSGIPLLNSLVPVGTALPPVVEPRSLAETRTTLAPAVGPMTRGAHGRWGFPVRVPILRDGRLRYVLTAVISESGLADIVERDPKSEEYARVIIDRTGVIAARTSDTGTWVGRPAKASFVERARRQRRGVAREVTLTGVDVYAAHATTPFGWSVAISSRAEAVDAPLRQSMAALAIFGGIMLLLSVAAATLMSRRISKGIASASRAAASLGRGELPTVRGSSVEEIALLLESLQRSAALLTLREHERDESLTRAETARELAEAASRSKDEFLAMLGHELRNPLSPIVLALELMRHSGQSDTAEFAIIERQVGHLERLLDDLLDVSRISRGKVELRHEPVDVASVVTAAVEMARPLVEQRRHDLRVELASDRMSVLGDRVRLTQVLGNLLVNAAKYTDEGGSIALRAHADDGEIVIEVADNGRGIAPELLPKVFDLFVQGQRSIDRREGGLGIGLTLVRSLVTLHGGSVEARSDGPGAGSTFIVRLLQFQREAEAVAAPVTSGVRHEQQTPMRILVVDDNVDAAALLSRLLEAHGHDVRSAHDGREALNVLEDFHPDLALLDIGLPVFDGFELAGRIRAIYGERAPLMFAVSGYGQDADRVRSLAAGFVEHFVKPVDAATLLAAVAAAVTARRAGE